MSNVLGLLPQGLSVTRPSAIPEKSESNNTRVTTSAHQRTVVLLAISCMPILRKILNLTNNVAPGKGHVECGVSIWYRKTLGLLISALSATAGLLQSMYNDI